MTLGNRKLDQKQLLTFDVEFWYEGYRMRNCLPEISQENRSRDSKTFLKVLDLLDQNNSKSTCFVLGRFAEQEPDLVKEISRRGHEVATHGYQHYPVPRLISDGKKGFIDDLKKSISILEDLTGKKVLGHRATSWSVREVDVDWFFDVLIEQGLVYDSSLFPASFHPFGTDRMPSQPLKVLGSSGSIFEIPGQTLRFLGYNWPVLGGFYLRAVPLFVSKMITKFVKSDPQMLYFHPYEFDEACPKYPAPFSFKLMRYTGLYRSFPFLEWYLRKFETFSVHDYCLEKGNHLKEVPNRQVLT